MFAVPFNLREGKLLSWNIAFQRDLWWGFTAEAAYVGNVGRGIVDRIDLNAATSLGAGLPGNDNAARPLFQKYGRSASVTTWIPVNTHHYNSLQVKVDRRLKRDLLVTTSYTLSRTINYDDESGNIGTPANLGISLGLAGYKSFQQIGGRLELFFQFAGREGVLGNGSRSLAQQAVRH